MSIIANGFLFGLGAIAAVLSVAVVFTVANNLWHDTHWWRTRIRFKLKRDGSRSE
jgi:hypothetical protein